MDVKPDDGFREAMIARRPAWATDDWGLYADQDGAPGVPQWRAAWRCGGRLVAMWQILPRPEEWYAIGNEGLATLVVEAFERARADAELTALGIGRPIFERPRILTP